MTMTMRAARMHKVGEPMRIDTLPIPKPGPGEVRVAVHAVNIVPNLLNVLRLWPTQQPNKPLPTLPAIFGLDAAGIVDAVGGNVENVAVGDRVYVNPARYCGTCRACLKGEFPNCARFVLCGYFGNSPASAELIDRYHGGLAEFMVAPAYAMVTIPEALSFNAAARFGYLGTMYAGLRRAEAGPGKSILINGISGTLGIGAPLLARAMGLTHIFGTGRDKRLLELVDGLAPGRFRLHSLLDGPLDEWIREETGGRGVDIVVDALGPGAPPELFVAGLRSVAKGGIAVDIGAPGVVENVAINLHALPRMRRSGWFTTAEGQEMADLVEAGFLDLSAFDHQVHPLGRINEAMDGLSVRDGGFTNFIINPQAVA